MSELWGEVKERQRRAYENPIWRIAQAQDEIFRHFHQLPNGLWLQSVLTVDCFEQEWAWHCAVGLLRQIGKPGQVGLSAQQLKQQMFEFEAVPLTSWQQSEYGLAISTARALLAGIGEAQSVSWTQAAVFELTLQAWRTLTADELVNVTRKMEEVKNIAGYQFKDRSRVGGALVMPATVMGH